MIDPTTHAISEFATPTAYGRPWGITVGPDGNIWFTEFNTGKIGMINPATHAISEFAIPGGSGSQPEGITAGPDGNLWFTETVANEIGMINPTTGAIIEFALPTPNAQPLGIAAGSDGNIWFTELYAGQIGMINPTTEVITEYAVPYTGAGPSGITAGPDGIVWFTDQYNGAIGVVTLNTDNFVVTQQPPESVTAGTSFGLTVQADDSSGHLDSSFNGTVTVALENNPGGATLGGTLSVTASGGVATFSGLTLDKAASGCTLQVSSSSVNSATTSAITVTPAPASQLVITQQQPASVQVNSSFGLQATIEDPYGNVEASDSSDVTVALAINPGAATLGGTLMVAASQGVANFSGLTLNSIASGYTLAVSSSGLTGATTNPINVTPVPATRLVITQEPPSSLSAGTPFALTVQVQDNSGDLAFTFDGTITVALANDPSGAKLGGTLSATASGGIATFPGLKLTKVASGYTIQVSSSGLSGATTSAITVTPAPASQVLITQQPPSSVTAGSLFGLQATIEDPYGNVETGDSDGVSVALATNASGATLGGTTSITANQGVASFSALMLTKAGQGYTIQVSSGTVSGTTSAITVTPAPATQLVVTQPPPDSAAAGPNFGLTVDVEDVYGNLAAFSGSVSVAIATGPAGATLGGRTTVTASGSVATFAGLALTRSGSYTLAVSSSGLLGATTGPLVVTPAAPSQLAVTTQPPASVTADSGFGLAVAAEDQYGNPTPSFSGAVTITSGGSALGGTTTVSASGGIASFSGLILDNAGTYILQVSSSGLASATTGVFTVTPTAAVQLALVSEPPGSVTAGAPFGFELEAEDPFGNQATGFNGTVTVALTAGPAGGTLAGPASFTATQGLASLADLMIDQAGSGYTLQVSSAGLTGATTSAFGVTAAAAAQLVISSQPPASVTAGDPFGLAISVEDAYGNVATSFNGPVAIGLANNPGAGALGGARTAMASHGLASFTGLALDTAGSPYTIEAASGSLSAATTRSIVVAPAAAARLVVSIPPPTVMSAGADFGLAIAAQDPYGNLATGFTGTVTIALANHPAGATLLGPAAATATAGVANFNAFLSLDTAASGYMLTAASDGLPSVTTGPITVTALPATHLVVLTQPPSLLSQGASFGLVVVAKDRYGNVDPSFDGKVSVAVPSGSSSTLGGTTTVAAGDGMATFTGLTLSQSSSPVMLEAVSTGLTGAATNSISVTAPTQLAFAATSVTVDENARDATIKVVRTGGYQGAVSAGVTTSGGTAVAGVNYTAINEVVNFAASQASETFTIPVKNVGVLKANVTVNVVLSNPGANAVLGSPSTETLVIQNSHVTPAPLVTVTGVQPETNNKGAVTGIVIDFSGAVNMAEAQSKSTYELVAAGTGGSFTAKNAKVIKITSAVYDAAADQVTLKPAPFGLSKPVELVVYGTGPNGLQDIHGRFIDGKDNGMAGSNAVAILKQSGVTKGAVPAGPLAIKLRLARG